MGRKLAARRVARTIMLGSAPTSRDQAVRGLEASRIRLGVVQPGESIADFNDALIHCMVLFHIFIIIRAGADSGMTHVPLCEKQRKIVRLSKQKQM